MFAIQAKASSQSAQALHDPAGGAAIAMLPEIISLQEGGHQQTLLLGM
jgi:hypothetical protein